MNSMLIWMVIVGLVVGVISSMFVRGSRRTGLIQTTVLGGASYVFGWLTGELWGVSVLGQWLVAIAVSLVLLVGFSVLANSWNARGAGKVKG